MSVHELPRRSERFVIDGRSVIITGEDAPTEAQARAYLTAAEGVPTDHGQPVAAVAVKVNGDDADLTIDYKDGESFERIRRITGYLVGTTARFNDAKQAEERERVKHPCAC